MGLLYSINEDDDLWLTKKVSKIQFYEIESLTCWCSQSWSSLRRCLSELSAQRWRVIQPEIVIVKKNTFSALEVILSYGPTSGSGFSRGPLTSELARAAGNNQITLNSGYILSMIHCNKFRLFLRIKDKLLSWLSFTIGWMTLRLLQI